MTLTLAGWFLVAAPFVFCGGVWFGRRLERAQQKMNAEAVEWFGSDDYPPRVADEPLTFSLSACQIPEVDQ